MGEVEIVGIIHDHPWMGNLTDLRFSENIPLARAVMNYDRDIMNEDENLSLDFYLYAPDGKLWMTEGGINRGPDKLIVTGLPWDPFAHETANGPRLGPYTGSWKWTKQ